MPLTDCAEPYAEVAVEADLAAIRGAMVGMDSEGLDAAARRLEAGLGCLAAPLEPSAFAAVYRYLGAWTWVLRGDESGAARWFRASLELEPDHRWPVDELPPDHPAVAAWNAERAGLDLGRVAMAGKELAPAATWHLDGRRLDRPEATGGRPHVLQRLADADGPVTDAWLLDGYRFPEAALVDAPAAQARPDRGGRTGGASPRVALLAAGAAGVAAAGVTYGLAWVSADAFARSDTTAEAQSLRGRTNGLLVASAGALAVGVGVGTWGLFVDGRGVAVQGRF